VPTGAGVTGLWRPTAVVGSSGPDPLQLAVSGDTLYTLIQNGATLTGKLEAPAGGFGPGGGAGGGPIEGSVDGKNISFRVGTTTYSGTVNGEQIELRKMSAPFPGAGSASPVETGPRPAIGPLPDGSDPSLAGFRSRGTQPPILLRRASR
jgi:beta-galactosidase